MRYLCLRLHADDRVFLIILHKFQLACIRSKIQTPLHKNPIRPSNIIVSWMFEAFAFLLGYRILLKPMPGAYEVLTFRLLLINRLNITECAIVCMVKWLAISKLVIFLSNEIYGMFVIVYSSTRTIRVYVCIQLHH